MIFKEGVNIQGLTTAASVWATAAMGLLCGLGLWPVAVAAAAIVLSVLTVLHWIELRLPARVRAQGAFRFRAARNAGPADFRAADAGAHGWSSPTSATGSRKRARPSNTAPRSTTAAAASSTPWPSGLRTVPGLVEFDLVRISK